MTIKLFPKFLVIFCALFCFTIDSHAKKPESLFSLKGASYAWTVATHPAEAITHTVKNKNTCAEQQHCIPQSLGGSDATTAYWARSNHSVSDRWKSKRFLNKHENPLLSLATFTNDKSQANLNAAYRMGAYGLPYTVLFHEYNRDSSSFVFMELDGPSMLLYGVSWLLNTPQKIINQLAYTIESGSEPNLFYLIDVVLAIFVAMVDFVIGVIFTMVGFVVGFIVHPIDSLCSLLGLVYFLVPTVWTAGSELVLGIIRLFPFI